MNLASSDVSDEFLPDELLEKASSSKSKQPAKTDFLSQLAA
jgi:hypothetical protein